MPQVRDAREDASERNSVSGTSQSDPPVVSRPRSRWWIAGVFAVSAVLALLLLRWSGSFLVAPDPLPSHVDVAVVLQGSISGERVRIAGAMALLEQGVASRVLLSVPKESYWGESVPPLASRYLERNYGADLASRVDFCETGPEVNSTEQEAAAAVDCIRAHGWQAVAVVTSDYHTRRARYLWRKVLRDRSTTVHVWVTGVPDPEFQARGWWRHRLYAKTWFLESTKLVWAWLFG